MTRNEFLLRLIDYDADYDTFKYALALVRLHKLIKDMHPDLLPYTIQEVLNDLEKLEKE